MQRISIDPITRLEGHGKIEIFLDDQGDVGNTYFQIPELRGFEQFAVGRPVEEMAVITNRICGVCPEAHHMAAAKAADAVYHVDPPRPAKLLRELLYSAFYCTDHTTHFYALGGPDFVMGPDAPVAERNILGVIHKVGLEIGGKVIQMRKYGHTVIEMIGGRKVHPCTSVPGGMSHGITEEQRTGDREDGTLGGRVRPVQPEAVQRHRAGQQRLQGSDPGRHLLPSHLLHRPGGRERTRSTSTTARSASSIPDGVRIGKYAPHEYPDWIAERVEPWTYLKFPYLKKVGWQGFVDGPESGVYMATPLSRLNAADGMATPLAQAEYEKMFEALGKPVHHRLGHPLGAPDRAALRRRALGAARLRSRDHFRQFPHGADGHADRRGRHRRGAAWHADPPLRHRRAGRGDQGEPDRGHDQQLCAHVHVGREGGPEPDQGGTVITEGLLNRVEMAFRAYDPCMSCATHSLPGQMPLEVTVRDARGAVVAQLSQYIA